MRQVSGMPLSWCSPTSSNARPEPATRSFTVQETKTSPGPARAAIRAPIFTAIPTILSDDLALTGVETRADFQAELAERRRDRGGAPDHSDGSVERREESIAGCVDLGSSETTELLAD